MCCAYKYFFFILKKVLLNDSNAESTSMRDIVSEMYGSRLLSKTVNDFRSILFRSNSEPKIKVGIPPVPQQYKAVNRRKHSKFELVDYPRGFKRMSVLKDKNLIQVLKNRYRHDCLVS